MIKKDISDVIKGFDNLNLHFETPKYTSGEILELEKSVKCNLPPDFKKTLLAGYIDKGTFMFVPLSRYERNRRFLIFGKWNDDTFFFDTEAKKKDFPVFVIASHGEPEKCFNNFHDWLDAVLIGVNRAHFPG